MTLRLEDKGRVAFFYFVQVVDLEQKFLLSERQLLGFECKQSPATVGLHFFCLHLTSRHCPFFHTVSSFCRFFATVVPSFSLAEFVGNCPTYCTSGESIAVYHHFSFQTLERNLKIFSWRAGKYTTVTSTLRSTERQWVVCKYMQILIKFNL